MGKELFLVAIDCDNGITYIGKTLDETFEKNVQTPFLLENWILVETLEFSPSMGPPKTYSEQISNLYNECREGGGLDKSILFLERNHIVADPHYIKKETTR